MQATLRFYATLNDFLPTARRQVDFDYVFEGRVSVKDAIESAGVPHPEVEVILVNGAATDFTYHVQVGDRVSVYPFFHTVEVPGAFCLSPPPPAPPRFVLDGHLGRLAAYLRLAGFDTLYETTVDDEALAEMSAREQCILLTRDVGLLKRAIVMHGYWLRESNPRRQLAEVAARFDLSSHIRAFSRCLRCNGAIEPVPMETVVAELPPRVRAHFREFHRCRTCSHVYWKGPHYDALRGLLESIRQR